MKTKPLAIACLAYILGLLLTGLPLPSPVVAGWAIPLTALGLGMVGGAIATLPRPWRLGLRRGTWGVVGGIGVLAVLYFQWRLPQPQPNDISRLLTETGRPTLSRVVVTGFVATAPRLTRNQTWRFELEAFQTVETAAKDQPPITQEVSGSVYTTVPRRQGEALLPGQMVSIGGSLYQPKPADNPGGFDFRAYLARQGIFAGLRGQQVDFPETAGRFREHLTGARLGQRWVQQGLWRVRQRIVRSHAQGLEEPAAGLVSAMLLGKNAVDVDYDLRDRFSRVGLAHALAASGFQVSLLLGILLKLTGQRSNWGSLAICATGVLIYVGLTGLEPSVLRAALMGGAVLLAIALDRKVAPLPALLLVGTGMLVWNPVWIWDLGFQMSFLATLGLIVTVPVLDQRLDGLPPLLASLLSVPVAAYLWTLPLQLHVFGGISPYSIPLNVLTTFLITLISLGSGVSALLGLVHPPLGGGVALLLGWPTHLLLRLAEFTDGLPGSALAAGTIAASQVVALYGLYGLVWVLPSLGRRWWAVGIVCLGLVLVPALYTTLSQVQITLLATRAEPVLVVQQRGAVGLVGVGDRQDLQFTVLPFLRRQGVNQIQWAIALTATPETLSSWSTLLDSMAVQTLETSTALAALPAIQTLPQQGVQVRAREAGQKFAVGAVQAQLAHLNPPALHLQTAGQRWLLLPQRARALNAQTLPAAEVVGWSGRDLPPQVLQRVKPEVAIASSPALAPATQQLLQKHNITTFVTGRDGAIQWTPKSGFTSVRAED